jgi:cation transport ATPase
MCRLHVRLLVSHTDNLLDDVQDSAERQSARYSAEQRSAVKRLSFALVFTVPLITITMGLGKGWFGLTSSEHSRLRILDHVLAPGFDVNTLVQLVLTTPVQFISGWVFHKSAWVDVRHRRLGMNFLISAGTTAAYLYSCISVILGLTSGTANGDALFFDTSALLISFILLGKMMEKVARHRASNAVGKLMNLRPATAIVMTAWPNVQREASDVPISTLRVGDVVKVIRGTAVPSDGVVVQGTATIDESMLTGESMPVSKVRQSYIPDPVLDAKATHCLDYHSLSDPLMPLHWLCSMTGSGQYCDWWNSDTGGLTVLQSHAYWQQLHPQSDHLNGAFPMWSCQTQNLCDCGPLIAVAHSWYTGTDCEVCLSPLLLDLHFTQQQHTQVARAQASKPPIQELGDRIASVFVPVVCGLSLFTFLIWTALTFSGAVPERW